MVICDATREIGRRVAMRCTCEVDDAKIDELRRLAVQYDMEVSRLLNGMHDFGRSCIGCMIVRLIRHNLCMI